MENEHEEKAISYSPDGDEITDDDGNNAFKATNADPATEDVASDLSDGDDGLGGGAVEPKVDDKADPPAADVPDSATAVWEEVAKDMGWTDKSHYKGPDGKFVDAKTFVKNAPDLGAKSKDTKDRLMTEITDLRDGMKSFHNDTRKMMDRQTESHVNEIKELREKYEGDKIEAIKDADVDAVNAADEKLDDLNKHEEALKPDATPDPAPSQPHPDFVEWKGNNEWYGEGSANYNEDLTAIADKVSADNPDLPYKQMLKLVDRKISVYSSEMEETSDPAPVIKSQRSAAVAEPGLTRASNNQATHSFTDLDDDAQNACNKYVSMGVFKDKQAYVDDYFKYSV